MVNREERVITIAGEKFCKAVSSTEIDDIVDMNYKVQFAKGDKFIISQVLEEGKAVRLTTNRYNHTVCYLESL